MKLAISILLFAAVCVAIPGEKLDEREHNAAIRDVSGSLATTVGLRLYPVGADSQYRNSLPRQCELYGGKHGYVTN
jgi:hypothetical protein